MRDKPNSFKSWHGTFILCCDSASLNMNQLITNLLPTWYFTLCGYVSYVGSLTTKHKIYSTMSQKVNPHALRSQNQLNYQASTSNHEIFFSEPKQSKWGLNSYSRIFHEDQTIETYLEGFFRSFGFYQKTCVIERKCNKTVQLQLMF